MPNGEPCDHMGGKVFSGRSKSVDGEAYREWICKGCGAEGHNRGVFRMDKEYPVWRDFWRIKRTHEEKK